MENKELYTDEEMALFQAIEKNIDNGVYKPLEASKLDEKKKLFKQVANNTLEKMTTKKSYNLRLFENDIEYIYASNFSNKSLTFLTFVMPIPFLAS